MEPVPPVTWHGQYGCIGVTRTAELPMIVLPSRLNSREAPTRALIRGLVSVVVSDFMIMDLRSCRVL